MVLNIKIRHIKKKIKTEEGLVTFYNPLSRISEEYRKIRTNLKFTSDIDNYKTIMITSPKNEEGKSTIIVNLAISIAQQGERVLIVDANLRNPVLHRVFNIDNSLGLSSILSGKSVIEGTVTQSEVSRLDVLTSGPTPINPTELLGSISMKKLLKKLYESYDWILFDSTAVLEVADATVVASQCEGVIMVVARGKTENEDALEAKRILENVKTKVLGVIITDLG